MSRGKDRVELVRERKTGTWVVKISLYDGKTIIARPGTGGQKIVYDRPQNVPNVLKSRVIPKLIDECKLKMMRGE